ncbi:vomeronasal type-2 receptor 26-like [Protopterus annectens]|uniref:vomeronasal type-2 receptor 26-like n=1 Tax=Protopterus annectens TaxID=7888 RepID=UPI001CFA72F0|nr:vomeronasal type-2 receptor 26-like [Protopterus annectens]
MDITSLFMVILNDYGLEATQEFLNNEVSLPENELLNFVKTVHFMNTAGQEIYFDMTGNIPNQFDIQNFQFFLNGTSRIVKIGYFKSWAPNDQQIQIDKAAILWNNGASEVPHAVCSESCGPGYRKSTRKGQPICCFDCTPCPEGKISNQTDSIDCTMCPDDAWSAYGQDKCIPKTTEFLSYKEELGASLAAFSIFFSALTASVLCVFIQFRDTPVIRANNRNLSYLLLLALFFCFLCSLLFIGHPERVTCLIRQIAFGVIFSFSVSCIMAKTITVIVAFTATKPNSSMKKWVGGKTPGLVIILCSLGQIIICTTWLFMYPPFPNNNMKIKLGKIIIECQEGSSAAFTCMLGYMGFLAMLCFVIAFLARKLPDTFNEAQMITTSMFIFLSVWTSFIPAYLSTQGKYMVAVEVFAILASSAGLLFSIFIPKCYILLLRPEKNTREYITGKLLNLLSTVHFMNTEGQEVYFDKNGDVPSQFDIQNIKFFLNGTSRIVKVGTFKSWTSPDKQIEIDAKAILWIDGATELAMLLAILALGPSSDVVTHSTSTLSRRAKKAVQIT